MISQEQIERLARATQTQDYLRDARREIAQLQRIVFHNLEGADWSLSDRVAEQILLADIVTRHRGDLEHVREDLRAREERTGSWQKAVHEFASYIHSYFTTPLGIMMRRELFGNAAVFLSPEAVEWIEGRETPDTPRENVD